MFTGIIKHLGEIKSIAHSQNNIKLEIASELSSEVCIDQSIAHHGICLTVESTSDGAYSVIAIEETRKKTTIGNWRVGQKINLETAMKMDALLDGHILQGHVDGVCRILQKSEEGGSTVFRLSMPDGGAALIVEKGSVALDGVSLTCFGVDETSFSVAIIPYTMEHTAIQYWQPDSYVNIEYDILAKLVSKQIGHYLSQTNLGK